MGYLGSSSGLGQSSQSWVGQVGSTHRSWASAGTCAAALPVVSEPPGGYWWARSLDARRPHSKRGGKLQFTSTFPASACDTLAIVPLAKASHKAKARFCMGGDRPRARNEGSTNKWGLSLLQSTTLSHFHFPEEKEFDDKESEKEYMTTTYYVLQ